MPEDFLSIIFMRLGITPVTSRIPLGYARVLLVQTLWQVFYASLGSIPAQIFSRCKKCSFVFEIL